jgi:hypothetical protein
MRFSFYIFFIFIFTFARSQEKRDSTGTKLKAFATVSVNSNGIASIPAFSLDKPAIIASANLIKGRFSYDPTLAYGFDLRPWYIDNWLHYKFVARPVLEMTAGFNISSFFTQHSEPDEIILRGERYFAFALTAVYKTSSSSSLTFAYWNDRGQEKESIKGHFLSITGERTDFSIGNSLLLSGNIMLFYINYEGNNDGLFVSPKISLSARDYPFSIFFQATQAIKSNIEPFPGFRWNVGIAYTF